MTSPVDEIKDRLTVVDVLQGYIRLTKAGKNYKGLCPFHTEKTPSFHVSPEKNMWYCFGCGEGGDIFSFVQKIEGVEFTDALATLAQKAGIELKREDPGVRSQRAELYEIVELATKFFAQQLESSVGKKVVEYLAKRGVKPSTIKDWRLGYAPDTWQGLNEFLKTKGYSEKNVELAGLLVRSEKSRHPYHDRFRHRIMFPVFDHAGVVVGFSGRVFDQVSAKTVGEDAGKYINTPNTPVYDKSRALYGLHSARSAIKEKEFAIIVEGNLDVILSHQAGETNVVATSGTALATEHLRILKRYTDSLALCFDNDEAGERAAFKGGSLATSSNFSVSVISLIGGKDTADVVRKDPSLWVSAINQRSPYISFVIARTLAKTPPTTAENKKIAARAVLSEILNLNSPVEREAWAGDLAGALGTSEQSINAELKSMPKSLGEQAKNEQPIVASKLSDSTPQDTLEEYLLAVLLLRPAGIGEVAQLVDQRGSDAVKSILKRARAGEDLESLLTEHSNYTHIRARAAFLDELIADPEAELKTITAVIVRRALKNRLTEIENAIKIAQASGDISAEQKLIKDFQLSVEQLRNYGKEKTSQNKT